MQAAGGDGGTVEHKQALWLVETLLGGSPRLDFAIT